ncbi:hypothetical protein FAI41_04480 [Acetobacteraceae bacterium]|nr:hypothetical protein FAI41_04480 [Acetobacteraceae bacterium]
MKKKLTIMTAIFTGSFLGGISQADVISKMEPFRTLPDKLEIPKNLPLPENIKIVENLPFGGRFYMYEDDSSAHHPSEPTLILYSPYFGSNTWDSKNELRFSLKQGLTKYACRQKLPYRLALDGMVMISAEAFAKQTKCLPSIGLLWFDNGETVPIGSDKSSCVFMPKQDENGEAIKNDGNYFTGFLDAFADSSDWHALDYEEKYQERTLVSKKIAEKTASLFQHHLPIAVSYGDVAVSFTYPDPTPIKEFQKKLNDPKVFQETFEYSQSSILSFGCG